MHCHLDIKLGKLHEHGLASLSQSYEIKTRNFLLWAFWSLTDNGNFPLHGPNTM